MQPDAEAFLELKELDTLTTLKLRALADKQDEVVAYFKEVLPSIIVDHNLYETEDKKMSNKEIANFIYEKLELSTKIMTEYTKAIFRVNTNAEDGNKVTE